MLTTKADALRSLLSEKVPEEASFEDYISNFNEENVYTFIVNSQNIDVSTLMREISELGFFVINCDAKSSEKTFIRVKET